MTTILVIDDHPIVAQGCRQLMRTPASARPSRPIPPPRLSAPSTVSNPDVVIVDLGIDGNELAGLDLIERLRAGSKAAVLVFSMHRDPIIVSRSLNAGANGYLVKDSAATKLVEAVRGRWRTAGPISTMRSPCSSLSMGPTSIKGFGRPHLARAADSDPSCQGKPYSEIAASRVSYKTVVNTSAKLKTLLGARPCRS